MHDVHFLAGLAQAVQYNCTRARVGIGRHTELWAVYAGVACTVPVLCHVDFGHCQLLCWVWLLVQVGRGAFLGMTAARHSHGLNVQAYLCCGIGKRGEAWTCVSKGVL